MKTTTSILTVTLPTGETVLAKSEIVTDPDALIPRGNRQLVPLRYGNETAARKKLDFIQPLISPARSASITKQDGRFLVVICHNPKFQEVFTPIVHRELDKQFKGRIFATTSGTRSNPRNRHNHNHKDQTDVPYHFG